jgi:hypothetical protein
MQSAVTLLVLFPSARAADYTGDGIDDLVVGVPFEQDIGGVMSPGAIEVIRGSTSGLTTTGDAFIHQNTMGVPDSNQDNEDFGFALAACDADGNGTDEIIVGAPEGDVGTLPYAGSVWRLGMTPTRLSLRVSVAQQITQDTTGVYGLAETDDYFGMALTCADFDDDGYDDVVVGIPGEETGSDYGAGGIEYFRGSATGLTTTGQLYYDQDSSGIAGLAETGDSFGSRLAAGDFDDDGYADLAIGILGEDWTGTDEGAVQVMYGSSIGPSTDDEIWTAGEGTAAGTLQDDNICGSALAVGDHDADGYDDLAIGCQGYTIGSASHAGAVLLLYGSSAGLDDSELWSQDSSGVIGLAEDYDEFGTILTSGDYDDDGYDDLVIAAPDEDYGAYIDDGVVQVLFGSSGGITDAGNLFLAQDAGSTVGGTPADNEYWGTGLTSGDYDVDGYDDLAVGSPHDDDGGATEAGVVNVFYGSSTGPSTTGDQLFSQDTVGIEDSSEASDLFGYSLR